MVPEVPRDDLIRARSGDRAAFRRVVETLARYVYNLAYRMTYDAAEAEDLSQEIFLRLFRSLERFDETLPFGPWFRTLAVNRARNWKRAARGRPAPVELAEIAAPDSPDGGDEERVRRGIADLPEEYRMAVTLRYLDELPVEEIARTMETPVGTVKTWLFRAREMLKQKWTKNAGGRR